MLGIQALQTAFQQLRIVPDILCPSFWRTTTKKHLTWSGLTQVEVLGDGKIKLWSWDSECWAWVEATVQDTAITGAMMSLFIDGMTEVAENCSLDLPKRQAASLSTAVLFNEACLKHSQQQRLLVQKDGFSVLAMFATHPSLACWVLTETKHKKLHDLSGAQTLVPA